MQAVVKHTSPASRLGFNRCTERTDMRLSMLRSTSSRVPVRLGKFDASVRKQRLSFSPDALTFSGIRNALVAEISALYLTTQAVCKNRWTADERTVKTIL